MKRGGGGVFIEANEKKFAELQNNYKDSPSVHCVNETVSAANPIDVILRRHTKFNAVDFVSIDVDGPDLAIALASNLSQIGAKVVLIEGGFNFDPRVVFKLSDEVAAKGCGQPIAVMIAELKGIGYEAVCFFQDIYLVRADLMGQHFANIRRDPVSLYADAWNFASDNTKMTLDVYRQSINAKYVEDMSKLEFMFPLKS